MTTPRDTENQPESTTDDNDVMQEMVDNEANDTTEGDSEEDVEEESSKDKE